MNVNDVTKAVYDLTTLMADMDDQQRKLVFDLLKEEYCQYCGGPEGCPCWNDD